MKLFAPRNTWDYKSANSWWNLTGQQSSAGVFVSYSGAESLSAVSCGIRVYSEAIAQLPCALLEQQDYRTTRFATEHPLWRLLHDEPNPEQTHFQFFAFMTACAVGWGNAYAEIQRDATGKIIALWPIHPSRIPKRNIKRNPQLGAAGWNEIEVGMPGEIVYYVNNDDGSQYRIAFDNMLHVPGMLSSDGITGRGIVEIGLSAIGIALATEEHAGAFFKNGAAPNIAIKSPKTVGQETAIRLRQQWQQVFGGVKNHYKTILLEDGMEPVPFFISPEASQLLTSRQFSVDEMSRILKLPPHKLNSMGRATWANIEQQAREFVDFSLMPYVKQWEETLYKKLLNQQEKRRFRFKINVMALLRGDSAARATFYRSLFDMGALSPNDIRELEDWNPIQDGDQYFVPANNLVPLDMISEMVEAQIEKLAAPPTPQQPQPAAEPDGDEEDNADSADVQNVLTAANGVLTAARDALELSVTATVEGMMHREARAAKQAAKKPETFLQWRDSFYPEFTSRLAAEIVRFVPAAIRVGVTIDPQSAAERYVSDSVDAFDSLLDLHCAEFEPALVASLDQWKSRPAEFTAGLFKQGA